MEIKELEKIAKINEAIKNKALKLEIEDVNTVKIKIICSSGGFINTSDQSARSHAVSRCVGAERDHVILISCSTAYCLYSG